MSVTQTFTVAEASVKHCPLVRGSCLTSRCMFWRRAAGFLHDREVDWPADIEKPQRPNSGNPEEDRAAYARAVRLALQPLVGGKYADTGEEIVYAGCRSIDPQKVILRLEKEPCGQCTVNA